ncbi:hypothetical protein C8J57DRAFT_1251660 [Mycena rebaudengoi]|nr:hypothetical protein C8J57DRAFT_1251660 [Mycena rebaudengoi]
MNTNLSWRTNGLPEKSLTSDSLQPTTCEAGAQDEARLFRLAVQVSWHSHSDSNIMPPAAYGLRSFANFARASRSRSSGLQGDDIRRGRDAAAWHNRRLRRRPSRKYILPTAARKAGIAHLFIESSCNIMFGMGGGGIGPPDACFFGGDGGYVYATRFVVRDNGRYGGACVTRGGGGVLPVMRDRGAGVDGVHNVPVCYI